MFTNILTLSISVVSSAAKMKNIGHRYLASLKPDQPFVSVVGTVFGVVVDPNILINWQASLVPMEP